MGAPRIPMTNFTKGEAAPALYARVDVPQYNALARKISNWIIQREGGLKFRPGFRFVGEAETVDEGERMVPFLYRQDQAYILTFSGFTMRPVTAGGFVVEEDLKLVSATNASSITAEIPFHDYAVGDRVFFDGNEGMDELNGQYATVSAVPDSDHVTFDIDSSSFGALTASTGTVRVGAPPAPPTPPAPLPDPVDPPAPPETTTGGEPGGSGGGVGGGPGGYNNTREL